MIKPHERTTQADFKEEQEDELFIQKSEENAFVHYGKGSTKKKPALKWMILKKWFWKMILKNDFDFENFEKKIGSKGKIYIKILLDR